MLLLKNLTATCIDAHFFSGSPSITATSLFESGPCLRKQEVFPHLAAPVSWTLSSKSLWGFCHCLLFMLLLVSLLLPGLAAKIKQASLSESNHFFQNHLYVSSSCITALRIILGDHFWPFSVPSSVGYFRYTLPKAIYKVFIVYEWHAFPQMGMTLHTNITKATTQVVDYKQKMVEVGE